MGFWSSLAGIGGAIAAPFTGGLSLLAGPLAAGIEGATSSNGPPGSPSAAGAVGQTAASIERARLDALIAQTRAQQEQDAERLAMAKFGLSAPGELARHAAQGDILANSKDATISGLPSYIHVPTIGGGLRPSLFSAATRALGAKMPEDALAASKAGTYNLTPSAIPSASAYDSILNGLATGGGFLNALSGLSGLHRGGPNSATGPLASGETPNDINPAPPPGLDPNAQGPYAGGEIPGQPPEPPAGISDENAGIDPALLQWWQQQATSPGSGYTT